MTLQKSNHGIDQICEQYGKYEDRDDRPSNVNDVEGNYKEQDRQDYIYRAAIGE
jgi:hypothetical protein